MSETITDWTAIKPGVAVRLSRGNQAVEGEREIVTFHNGHPGGNYRMGMSIRGWEPRGSTYPGYFMADDGWILTLVEEASDA